MHSVENILGYVMVVTWGVSFYPPIYINYTLQSCPGISTDFIILNEIGYLSLMQSMLLQFHTAFSKLTTADLVYCIHGLILNIIIASQVLFGDKWPWSFQNFTRKKMKKVYYRIAQASMIFWAICTVNYMYFTDKNTPLYTQQDADSDLTTYCNQLYLIKISLSFIKYIPQFLHNKERKSMRGYSMSGTYCDIIGGLASFAQLLLLNKPQNTLDSNASSSLMSSLFDKDFLVNNFGKLGIALVTISFQTAFICQYLLYKKNDSRKNHSDRMLKRPSKQLTQLETIIEMA